MITFRPIGQWGNQLFSYIACKIMAEENQLPFEPPPFFLTKSGQRLHWTGPLLFEMEPTKYPARSGRMQRIRADHWSPLSFGRTVGGIDVEHAYFQRYELIKPWKARIKDDWLRIRRPFVETDADAVYIHCRLTDYVVGQGGVKGRNGIATTIDEYRDCLAEFPDAKRLVIATDDPASPFLHEFDKLGLPWSVTGAPWDQDWLTLASSRWLLISQSTYSWWAGLLGRAERIVCPLGAGTLWAIGHGRIGPPTGADWVNLDVDDEPERWIWRRL